MTSRHAMAVSAVVLAASALPAAAAPPGFCSDYARSAIREFYRAVRTPSCAPYAGGPRWHANYPVHYGWCLDVPIPAALNEQAARRAMLARCSF